MKSSHSLFLTVHQRRHHVRVWGPEGAPVLVMAHGWSDVSASWQFLVDALSKEWRIYAPDWRGFGLSESNRSPYWFPEYLADLDLLLEALSPRVPVNLIGHSMGGNIGGLYAGIRPNRVCRFVNLEGTGLPPHTPDEAPGRYDQWLRQLRGPAPGFRPYDDYAAFAARLRKENPRISAEKAEFLARHCCVETPEGKVEVNFDPYHRLTNPILYRVEEAKACWKRVTAQVLFVAGRDSFFFKQFYPLESPEFRERLAAYQNLREVLLDDCGHNIHHDQPEQLAALIEDFIPFEHVPEHAPADATER
ncbi:MAG: alpha/beta hydrolase [Rhodocyclaceae bacterium]|nr:alpha/beta hydrolase [Rhodocyclaceae bacterium]MBK6907207.1 alpha/beta hydrolase [Rhodocyclaceae bacterium]